MPALNPARLSNLYKPAIILISMYAIVNLIGFFVQNDFSKTSHVFTFNLVGTSARNHLNFEENVIVTPAPPEIKIHSPKKQPSSGASINPHLP
jgi:hypothetical protein